MSTIRRSRFVVTVLAALLGACSEYTLSPLTPATAHPPADAATPPEAPAPAAPEEPTPAASQPAPEAPAAEPTPQPSADGDLTGQICDPSGNGFVAGAVVAVDVDDDGEADRSLSTTTDADGQFTLSGVPVGTHTLAVRRGGWGTSIDVAISPGPNELPSPSCLDDDRGVLVFQGDYDEAEALLEELGASYDMAFLGGSMQHDLLTDPTALAAYDLILLNCGMDEAWQWDDTSAVGSHLRQWVRAGGSLYVSDWAFHAVEAAFPGAVDFWGNDNDLDEAYGGRDRSFLATVADPVMQQVLGTGSVGLDYDLPGWAVAEAVGPNTHVLVEKPAPVVYQGAPYATVPLAMTFDAGQGTVVFTTFHHEAQISPEVEALLREMFLSL